MMGMESDFSVGKAAEAWNGPLTSIIPRFNGMLN
jgi:hypothetical protein